ncbi:MAG: hypothetical protein JNM59_14540 [Hyphomonadaceae bacterium]|nr:hypothetical protein [Hyphomonadaceae bacterium]
MSTPLHPRVLPAFERLGARPPGRRRFWLSLLMVIALASGGVANAMVTANCPMLAQDVAEPAMGEGHDCRPDDTPAAPDEQPAKKMGDCAMAQACRSEPAVAPGDRAGLSHRFPYRRPRTALGR